MRTRATICILSFGVILAALSVTPREAVAGRRGNIYILKKRLPFHLRSRSALLRFVGKYRTKHVWPIKKDKKKWHLEFFAFFRRKVDDREVKVRFYDVTYGRSNKVFIEGDSIYLQKRGQRELASSFTLERGRFKINRKIMMYIVDARRRLLASTVFWLRGKGEVFSGRVTFSDKDAAGK